MLCHKKTYNKVLCILSIKDYLPPSPKSQCCSVCLSGLLLPLVSGCGLFVRGHFLTYQTEEHISFGFGKSWFNLNIKVMLRDLKILQVYILDTGPMPSQQLSLFIYPYYLKQSLNLNPQLFGHQLSSLPARLLLYHWEWIEK